MKESTRRLIRERNKFLNQRSDEEIKAEEEFYKKMEEIVGKKIPRHAAGYVSKEDFDFMSQIMSDPEKAPKISELQWNYYYKWLKPKEEAFQEYLKNKETRKKKGSIEQ